tara:strand:- start:252 stop:608 length:357 start_codon:yes stop_codon:yes gene_type:complete
MTRLTSQEEKELILFIKDWIKAHGYSQKDLAQQLNINSSRTSEIANKMKALYKKGGIFNIAKNLIKIEQYWIKVKKNNFEDHSNFTKEVKKPYNQLDLDYKLDLDELMNQMEKDHKID